MANECIDPIYSNPDIAGIGIRINFHVTILLTSLVPANEHTGELLDGIYKNSVIYGLGLVITAIVQTAQKQLDLYHAIVVMQIMFSLTYVYLHRLHGQKRFLTTGQTMIPIDLTRFFFLGKPMGFFIMVQFSTMVMFIVWLLYVWIKGSKFGSQPSCNHLVKYVLFFTNVRATAKWLRVLFIIGLVSSYILLSFLMDQKVGPNMRQLLDRMKKLLDRMRRSLVLMMRHRCYATSSTAPQIEGPGSAEGTVPTYFKLKPSFVFAVYGVATLELIVHRNQSIIQPGENAWSFGQIISVILIFGIYLDWADKLLTTKSPTPNSEA